MSAWGKDPAVEHMVVFSSVPVVAGGPLAARVVYAAEEEKLPTHPDLVREAAALLDLLAPHAHKTTLFGGDVHVRFSRGRHGRGRCVRGLG